jgi:hypothetical protein
MATFRKSTLVIVAVQSADYENERCPSLEAEQADRPETEQKVLSQQAALQEMPRCGASGAQCRAQRHSGQAADEGVQAGPKLLIIPSYSGVPWCYPAGEREGGGYVGL